MVDVIKSKFYVVALGDMLDTIGEDNVKNILSSFSCPKNLDVQNFLRDKAILFSQKGFAKTYLVYWVSENNIFGEKQKELVGYYAIAIKDITIQRKINNKRIISKDWRKICAQANTKTNESICKLSAILIGQIGKNFKNGNELLIKGSDLLGLALKKVKEVQEMAGGKITYLECEESEKLIKFYEENGFSVIGSRVLDGDEVDVKGTRLVQLYRYLD